METPKHWIRPLKDLTLTDVDLVGGKAAHLGALLRAGFDVPGGFVITVEAFVEHLGHTTDPLVRPSPPRLSAEFMAEVVQALMEYLPNETSVAVRSSSTAEDGQVASFAGQHSTYYYIPPARLDQAIIDCWMSLWSREAIAYRRAGGGPVTSGEPLRMAVVVQQMLDAERSGVVFSRNPNGTDTHAIVEATWGLGAALVDGRVQPDQITVSEEAGLKSYSVGDKRHQVMASVSNPEGNRLVSVSRNRQQQAVLSDHEAEQLAELAWRLETLFDAPQDIEWCYVGEQLYLLQSRPITSLSGRYSGTAQLVRFQPIAENFTEPLTPLSEDLFAHLLPGGAHFVHGRLYFDIQMLKPFMPWQLTDAELAELMLLQAPQTQRTWSWPGALRLLGMLSLAFLVDGANWLRAARLTDADLQRYREHVERLSRKSEWSLPKLARRVIWAKHAFTPAYHQVFILNISSGRYFIFIGLLEALVKRFAPDYPISELPRTYHGREDIQAMAMLEEMQTLAELLQDERELRQTLQQFLNQRPEGAIATANPPALPPGTPFSVAFDQFLQKFGHRGAKEVELAAPRWREQPAQLLAMLLNPAAARQRQSHGDYLAARDQLHRHLKPWQRWLVDGLSRRISHFIALRENTRHLHILGFTALRERILKDAQDLVVRGLLKLPEDAFFLTMEELSSLVAEALTPATARARVRSRRRLWQQAAQHPAPATFNIEQTQRASPLCASPGEARGRARFINHPGQGHRLAADEILIAPYTDPSWTPLFCRAAGVIVATGSFLSHAGTVARELHLPCLVNAGTVIDEIKDGQLIVMNATTGEVTIAEDAA